MIKARILSDEFNQDLVPDAINFCAAEYERMLEAYSAINQKLQNFTSERSNLEKIIQELKVCEVFPLKSKHMPSLVASFVFIVVVLCGFVQANLRRHERDNCLAQKEIADLQKQVMEKMPLF